jgi:phosphate transport system substrate-binding protein
MRNFRYVGGALLAALWILPSAICADLRVVGTDLLGLEFTRAFYEFAGRNGVRLALAFDGSRSGLGELSAGRADVALVFVPPEETGALAEYRSVPLGYHPVVVLVSAACPLEKIAVSQLAAVFAADAAGDTPIRWGALGVTGAWADGSVVALAPEVGTGMAVEYFRRAALSGKDLKASVRRFGDASALVAGLAGGERALAVAAGVPADATGIKVLPVAAGTKSVAYAPAIGHLQSGDYPLCVPLYVVFKATRRAALGAVGEFLFGDGAARLLAQVDIRALPTATRAEHLRMLSSGQSLP